MLRRALFMVALLASPAFAEESPSKEVCLDAYTRSQPLRRDGKLSEARKALLVCARDPCPKQLQPDCVGWLDEVEKAMPSVVFGAKDADGKDLTHVRVFVDDQPLARSLDGRSVELDPGDHVLRFEHAGRRIQQTVVVKEGDKQRRVNVTFPSRKESDKPARRAQPSSSGAPPVAWALGGLGIVALGSFAYFGLTGISERSDLDSCKPNCATEDVKSVDRKFWIANISLAVAAVSLGGATYLFVTSEGSRPTTVGFRTSY